QYHDRLSASRVGGSEPRPKAASTCSGGGSPESAFGADTRAIYRAWAMFPDTGTLANAHRRASRVGVRDIRSVRGQARVDLVCPRRDATTDMRCVGETGFVQRGECLRGTSTGLAVQHDRLVLGQLGQCRTRQDLVLRDEFRAGNVDDLVLVRFAYVDELEVVTTVELRLEFLGRDGVARAGLLRIVTGDAAELLVVDQLGDLWSLRVLTDLHLTVPHLQRIVGDQSTEQRLPDAGNQFDRLVHHDRTDGGTEHTQHAALGTRGDHAWWRRFRVEIAVVQPLLVRRVLPEHADLALETEDR